MKYQKPKLTKHAQLRNITFSEEIKPKFTPMTPEEIEKMPDHNMELEWKSQQRRGYVRVPPKVKDE